MRFSWDKTKNKNNQQKHGVSFEAEKLIFDDPDQVTRQDHTENGELRWQTIGMANNVALLLVAHTWKDGVAEHIRIISARRASKTERNLYEQGTRRYSKRIGHFSG